MSSEAVGWVWKRSPYRGATFIVHQAIADSANDQHDYELWMTVSTLAKKARVTRRSCTEAISVMVRDGFLEELISPKRPDGKPTGKPGRYRLLRPDVPAVFETRREASARTSPVGVSSDDAQVSNDCSPDVSNDCSPIEEPKLLTQAEPNVGSQLQKSTRRGRRQDPLWDAVMAVCEVDSSKVTKSARGAYNRAVSEIRDVGGTPELVRRAAANYRSMFGDAALTPPALAKHWSKCQTVPRSSGSKGDAARRSAMEALR